MNKVESSGRERGFMTFNTMILSCDVHSAARSNGTIAQKLDAGYTQIRLLSVTKFIFTQLDAEEGVVEDILPRKTKFSRQYAGKHGDVEQVIVANYRPNRSLSSPH